MPSRVIRPTEAPVATPFPYTIGTADGLSPEAVFAEWDGTGAGGDFLPCVSYYSAEGVLLDRAFPDSGAVTAGDTAEVSYRPFKRGGGGGGGGVSGTLGVYIDSSRTFLPGGDVPFQFAFADGVALFDLSFPTAARFLTGGLYVLTAWAFGIGLPADAGKIGVLKMFQNLHGPAGPTGAAWQSFPLDASDDAASASVSAPWLVAAGQFMEVTLAQNAAGPRDFGCALNVVKIG